VPLGSNGYPKRHHLEQVWRQTGIKPKELMELVDPPEHLLYLSGILVDLASPLTYSELAAWCKLAGKHFTRWEIELLMALDGVRRGR
jgi:hypothetical protein